jgi:hypothetical protein
MPVNDIAIHNQVLSDLRTVVNFFHNASRGEDASPAYAQLRRTIDNVDAVITELEADPK